jgi:hypothetical protein
MTESAGISMARRVAIALVCALMGLSVTARAEDRALIIGVNKYSNLSASDQLTGSVNDANLMMTVARDRWGFKPNQIKLLLDEQATAHAIREALATWIVQGTKPGDRALIYYSGHGYFIADKNGDESDGRDEVLVASDAKAIGSRFANLIADDEIGADLNKLADRSVMLIADSCYSGSIERALRLVGPSGPSVERSPSWAPPTRGSSADKESLPALKVTAAEFDKLRRDKTIFAGSANRLVWTAVSSTQIAQEDVSSDPGPRNGVFTHAFAEGVDGAADANGDGTVTAAELLTYVRRSATNYCQNYSCRTGMDPTFEPGGEALAVKMSNWGGSLQPPSSPGSDAVSAIPPSASAFSVKVSLEPGASVKLGEQIKLRIESSKSGYLIVLDLRDDGKVYQLFPSVCTHPERKIRANVPLLMPDPSYGCTFTADERGSGKIIVLVTEDHVPLDGLLNKTSARGIEPVGEASQYLGEIAQSLFSIWTGDAQNRPVSWGLATARYTID